MPLATSPYSTALPLHLFAYFWKQETRQEHACACFISNAARAGLSRLLPRAWDACSSSIMDACVHKQKTLIPRPSPPSPPSPEPQTHARELRALLLVAPIQPLRVRDCTLRALIRPETQALLIAGARARRGRHWPQAASTTRRRAFPPTRWALRSPHTRCSAFPFPHPPHACLCRRLFVTLAHPHVGAGEPRCGGGIGR